MKIESDSKLIDWLNQVCLSKTNNTKELYTTVLRKYCDVIGMMPTQLIEEAEKELGLPYSKQLLPSHIGVFKNYLRENMAKTSRVTYLAIVNSFYGAHDITLSKKLLKREVNPIINLENDLDIKDDTVTKAFAVSQSLMKMIIAIQYTSGLSMSDVLSLKAGIIRENVVDDFVTCLKMRRQKTNVEFYTFLSPTATKLSLNYIDELKLEDTNFLICKEKGEQLRENDFLQLFRDTADNLGLKTPEFRGYNKFHSHNLRKMFYNAILNVGGWGMGELAEYFMGHKIPATRASYYKATPDKLKIEYMKFVPYFEEVLNGY